MSHADYLCRRLATLSSPLPVFLSTLTFTYLRMHGRVQTNARRETQKKERKRRKRRTSLPQPSATFPATLPASSTHARTHSRTHSCTHALMHSRTHCHATTEGVCVRAREYARACSQEKERAREGEGSVPASRQRVRRRRSSSHSHHPPSFVLRCGWGQSGGIESREAGHSWLHRFT